MWKKKSKTWKRMQCSKRVNEIITDMCKDDIRNWNVMMFFYSSYLTRQLLLDACMLSSASNHQRRTGSRCSSHRRSWQSGQINSDEIVASVLLVVELDGLVNLVRGKVPPPPEGGFFPTEKKSHREWLSIIVATTLGYYKYDHYHVFPSHVASLLQYFRAWNMYIVVIKTMIWFAGAPCHSLLIGIALQLLSLAGFCV